MIINMNHLINNINVIKKKTKTSIMAIVKSDAYGLGVKIIARTLVKSGVNYLVVNNAKEAKVLLQDNALKDVFILILSSLKVEELEEFDQFLQVIFSVNNTQDAHNLSILKTKHFVHIAIDTGMNRMGLKTTSEVESIIQILSLNDCVIIDGIYTHFASSADEYQYYTYQVQQFKRFIDLYPFKMIHSANSASLAKPLVGNYVRIGIALYGYNTNIKGLKPVCYLYAKPINLLTLEPGEYLGYDMTYQAPEKVKVAVLPIGYNEGLLQGISNISWKYKNNEFKQIARTCMNHSFLLVNDEVNYNSCFNLLGNNNKIYQLADELSCSVHQILCQMSKIKKIYFKRVENDLSHTNQYRIQKSRTSRKRKGSYQNINFRIVRTKWGGVL